MDILYIKTCRNKTVGKSKLIMDFTKFTNQMKQITGYLTIITFMLFLGVSCNNDSENVLTGVGIISFADPAVDGCGWIINIEDESFHLINLSEDFQIDGASVNLKYKIQSTSWTCPSRGILKMRQIEIIDMSIKDDW